jgi:hypothetical protein
METMRSYASLGAAQDGLTSLLVEAAVQGHQAQLLTEGRVRKERLVWRKDAEVELTALFAKFGLHSYMEDVHMDNFEFIQGALKNDDKRHDNLVRAILNDQAIPPLIATHRESEDLPAYILLDGHHRILATFQCLWPPYPLMRTIVVSYDDGRPFHWTDSDFGQEVKHAIPTYRSPK